MHQAADEVWPAALLREICPRNDLGQPSGLPRRLTLPGRNRFDVLPQEGHSGGESIKGQGAREVLHVVVADTAHPLIGAYYVVPAAH
jgi:hypothetical protein